MEGIPVSFADKLPIR